MSNAYSAAILSLAPAASATDIFTITGSATKTVYVLQAGLHGTQTTLGAVAIQLVKRSTANSGGTSTAPTRVPHDSASPAATATVLAYTANPSGLGNLVGLITPDRDIVPAVTSALNSPRNPYDFGRLPVVLRGTGEVLAFNLNGVTVTGGSFAAWCIWVEE